MIEPSQHRFQTLVLALAAVAPSIAGAFAARAEEAPQHSRQEQQSLTQRAKQLTSGVTSAAQTTLAWTRENLSPSAIKSGAGDVTDAARAHWFAALFDAQRGLERTLGVFELTSLDATGRARWDRIAPNQPLPRRVVLLIHGLDDPGDIWKDAAPAFWLGHDPYESCPDPAQPLGGHHVVRFDYPNDQPISRSADLLVGALRELRSAGASEVVIVAHSMGGLVARDVLTRSAHDSDEARAQSGLPRVPRLILLGTPNQGSHLAHLRWVMEVRDSVSRYLASDQRSWSVLLTGFVDGDGEAGTDLIPGSSFLTDLNSRPPLRDTQMTIVEGDYSSGFETEAIALLNRAGSKVFPCDSLCVLASDWIRSATSHVGDGAAPAWSMAIEGVEDHVLVHADHRSMITRVGIVERARAILGAADRRPPAIQIVLDRVSRDDSETNLAASEEDSTASTPCADTPTSSCIP